MMEILSKNYNNRNSNVALFEIAREYIPTTPDELPIEKNVLVAGVYGDDADFFILKGAVERVLEKTCVKNWDIYASENEFGYHPGRCAVLEINGKRLGVMGEIHPDAAKNYDIDTKVYCFTLDVDLMFENAQLEKTFIPLPKYPAVSRDLAVICDEDIPVLTLEKEIAKAAGKLLEEVKLFDVYQGKQIEAGKKSVAFNIVMRSAEATLTEEQINSVMKKSIEALASIGATLR